MGKVEAFFEWLLIGRVAGGRCPQCGQDTITVEDMEYGCTNCEFDGELPEVDTWI